MSKIGSGEKTEISAATPKAGFGTIYMGYNFVKVKGQVNNRCDFF